MRFRRIDRYLLLLAGLFVLAVLSPGDFPGEEILPDLYRVAVHRPILARAAASSAKGELDLVRLQSQLEAARREVVELKAQLDATRDLGSYFAKLDWPGRPRAIPGWVFAVDADEYRRTFSIDMGSRKGVTKGMPVVTGRALLGVVLSAVKNFAVVRRVDDPRFSIEVEVSPEQGEPVACIARGDGDGGIELRFPARPGALRPGARVFTSSYHPAIPPGLLVGWIAAAGEELEGSKPIPVRPAAALSRLAQVEVLSRG